VNENIFSFFTSDESESFFGIKPFYFSDSHVWYLL
jgi:hypothetical protein